MDFQVRVSIQGLAADALRDRLQVRFITPRPLPRGSRGYDTLPAS